MKQPKADSEFLAYLLIFLMMSFEDQIKFFLIKSNLPKNLIFHTF